MSSVIEAPEEMFVDPAGICITEFRDKRLKLGFIVSSWAMALLHGFDTADDSDGIISMGMMLLEVGQEIGEGREWSHVGILIDVPAFGDA